MSWATIQYAVQSTPESSPALSDASSANRRRSGTVRSLFSRRSSKQGTPEATRSSDRKSRGAQWDDLTEDSDTLTPGVLRALESQGRSPYRRAELDLKHKVGVHTADEGYPEGEGCFTGARDAALARARTAKVAQELADNKFIRLRRSSSREDEAIDSEGGLSTDMSPQKGRHTLLETPSQVDTMGSDVLRAQLDWLEESSARADESQLADALNELTHAAPGDSDPSDASGAFPGVERRSAEETERRRPHPFRNKACDRGLVFAYLRRQVVERRGSHRHRHRWHGGALRL